MFGRVSDGVFRQEVPVELRQLRYFVAVAEERSVTRAAVRLHITQPPLSAQLARLEHEVGVPLLGRHNRGVELTEAGEELLVHARRLLAGVDAATDAVRRVGQGRTGRLGLAFVAASAWSVLPPLLAQLRADLPDVTVDLVQAGPDEVVEHVRAGRCDLGLVHLLPQPPVDRDLDVAVVDREPLVAVLPRAHPMASGERVDLASLAAETFLAPTRTPRGALHPHLVAACRLAGFEPDVREVGLAQTVVAFVGAGLGVSVLPASAGSVCGEGAVAVPLRLNAPVVETALVRRRGSAPSPVTRRFLRLAMSTPEPDVLGPALARRPRS